MSRSAFSAILFAATLALAFAASAPSARAQEQEKKLTQRLMNPDMTLQFTPENKTFGGGKGYTDPKRGNAVVKDFYFTQRFSPKGFETKKFRSKSFWKGDFKFDTKPANVKTSRDAGKVFETKNAEVKDARESGKKYGTSTFAETRAHIERGKAQGAIDAEQNKGPKTIDDVRELLNKNK